MPWSTFVLVEEKSTLKGGGRGWMGIKSQYRLSGAVPFIRGHYNCIPSFVGLRPRTFEMKEQNWVVVGGVQV